MANTIHDFLTGLDRTIGFLAVSENVNRLYKEELAGHFVRLEHLADIWVGEADVRYSPIADLN